MKQIISIFNWFNYVEPSYIESLLDKLIRFRRDPMSEALKT
jgi:hypothetical protein